MSSFTLRSTGPELVSVRELSQDTSRVINGLLESRKTAVLTKRGRFVAMIIPIDPGAVEASTIDGLMAQSRNALMHLSVVDQGNEDEGHLYNASEAAKALGLEAPDRP